MCLASGSPAEDGNLKQWDAVTTPIPSFLSTAITWLDTLNPVVAMNLLREPVERLNTAVPSDVPWHCGSRCQSLCRYPWHPLPVQPSPLLVMLRTSE